LDTNSRHEVEIWKIHGRRGGKEVPQIQRKNTTLSWAVRERQRRLQDDHANEVEK
jgi:hypothetical protein